MFDADGVVQRTPSDWIDRVGKLCGQPDRAQAFVEAVFATEQASLIGEGNFEEDLQALLQSWGSPSVLDQALELWTLMEPDAEVLDFIDTLRSGGFIVGLASNQQSYRSEFMSGTLNYASAFDYLFYSHDLGEKKPSRRYFQLICDVLALEPTQIVFIDDHQANVDAAVGVGLRACQYHLSEGMHQLQKRLAPWVGWLGVDSPGQTGERF